MMLQSLTELQLDALREVGGIGAGHAATALSQLVDRAVRLEVPTIEIVDVSAVPRLFGSPEQLVSAVYVRLVGDIGGGVLFIATREAGLELVDLMHGRTLGTTTSFGSREEALLAHIAGILISAYLAAIARMADLDVLPSSPTIAFDMAGALLEALVSEVGMRAQEAVLVRTSFSHEGDTVEAAIFFVPDPDSLAVILGRIGMA